MKNRVPTKHFATAGVRVASATLLAFGLSGCLGGSSSSGGGNGGGDDGGAGAVAGGCSANISLASGGGGLTGHADFDGIHYFVHGNDLCALDPTSGTAFTVDSGVDPSGDGTKDVEVVLWGGGWSAGNGPENGVIDRVIYTADNQIRAARVEGGSGAPPLPERISSEANAFDIDMMRLASDYANPDNSALAYRKLDEDNNPHWYGVRVGDGENVDPVAFPDNTRPLAPLLDGDTGSATGWLVVEPDQLGLSGDVHRLDLDLEMQDEGMIPNVHAVVGPFVRAHFRDGSMVIGALDLDDNETFWYYDPTSDDLQAMGTFDWDDGLPGHFAAKESKKVFFTHAEDHQVSLYAIDHTGVSTVDTSPSGQGINAAFVVTTENHVVWAFNDQQGNGASEVRRLTAQGDVQTLASNDDPDAQLFTPVLGSADGWVFFHEQSLGQSMAWTAHAVNAGDTSDRHEFGDSMWVGASHPAEIFSGIGAAPVGTVSEVFLVEAEPDHMAETDQHLKAVNGADPTDVVDLGVLDQSVQLAPTVMMSNVALGPYRLMTAMNDLVFADTSNEDSARTVMTEENFGDIRTLPGF